MRADNLLVVHEQLLQLHGRLPPARCFFAGVEAALLAPVINHGGGSASYTLTQAGVGGATNSISSNSVNGMIVTPHLGGRDGRVLGRWRPLLAI